MYAGQNYGQTDDPITRCPRRTFQAWGIKMWYGVKGIYTRNAHMKYESLIDSSEFITKVEVFVHADIDAKAHVEDRDMNIHPGELKLWYQFKSCVTMNT